MSTASLGEISVASFFYSSQLVFVISVWSDLRLTFQYFLSLHDRKMCILGLCALIDLEHRPQAVGQVANQILPAAILLFNGLKRAYACRAEHENDDDDEDEDGEDEDDAGECRNGFCSPGEIKSS